jgi:biopolymer transport protein ExbB/TolQ
MSLQAEPDASGKVVRCPSCQGKIQIPEFHTPAGIPTPTGVNPWDAEKGHDIASHQAASQTFAPEKPEKPERTGWVESDPTNPNMLIASTIGLVITIVMLGSLMFFIPPKDMDASKFSTMQMIANLFFKHLTVSAVNTFFFFWAMAIVYLKMGKLRRQQAALYLDVLPLEIASDITSDNVGQFIDHIYAFPPKLRDSLMVNRIRKALELFEIRPSIDAVSASMSAQSDIDGMKIGGSFTMVKAFLWAIPILGFVGTVIGLSHAIGGMNFGDMANIDSIKVTLGTVTGGLGTAFDATLLGLVYALFLNFPMNAMMKAEDDNLNAIDAFCNDVLIPRLNDGASADLSSKFGGGETGAFVEALVKALGSAQAELLSDLRSVTATIQEQAANLDKRADAHAVHIATDFSKTMIKLREDLTGTVSESVAKTTDYVRTLASALQGLNGVLKDLGEKQVLIQQVKKKGWFS